MKVTVLLTTYNHEQFISDALESVLMQKVGFDYELLAGDDCSTDRTRHILLDFQRKHSDKVRLLLPPNNMGANGTALFLALMAGSRGEYIAILDGDDYWTFPYKLQRQVALLDEHPEYVMCFHNAYNRRSDGSCRNYLESFKVAARPYYVLDDFITQNFIPTSSIVARNGLIREVPPDFYRIPTVDWLFNLMYAQHGRIGYIGEIWGVRRVHASGLVSMKSNAEKLRMNITSLRIIDKTLGFQHTKRISETIFSYRCKLLKAAVGEHSGFEITAQALRILSLCFSNNHLLRAVVKHALPNSHLHATIRSLRRPLEPGFLSHRNPGVLARTRQVDCPLAIFVPYVGARSETFIRRHVEDLLPGRTAVVGRLLPQSDGDWTVDGPFLDRNSIRPMLVSPSILGLRQKGGYTSEMCENRTIKRFLRDFGVRVILGEYLHSSVRWLEVARDLNVTFFGHAHGYDVSARLQDPNWRAEYLRYNDAGGVITISDISRSKLLEIGLLPSKVHVIPYGVDVPGEAPSRPERPTIRCIAVGRMVGKKAPILTLDAFRRASDAFPQLKLDYIGDGELLPAARQFIQAFDLQDKVSLHGSQPNHVVRKMMAKADIFLQHSLTDPDTKDEEGLPLAILEAMACALPVVSTRHAGIPEAVVHGATGYLVNEGDSEAMGEQLKTLVHEPERARQMGQAGWARAKERFSWERQRKSLLALLELDAIG